jgi:hypothetical protein
MNEGQSNKVGETGDIVDSLASSKGSIYGSIITIPIHLSYAVMHGAAGPDSEIV